MLTHLAIRNVALIDALALDFATGFTALTGETGAGKSLLLDALGLTLGERADAGLIRHGQTVAEVSATFRPSPTEALNTLLEEQGLTLEDSTLTLRRQLKKEEGTASSKAWVNGTPVPAGVLAQLAAHLVDIHAQHGTQKLLSPSTQRDVLDALGNLQPQRAQTQQTFAAWQSARNACNAAAESLHHAQQNAALLTAWREELEQLAYQEGEEEALAQQRTRLQNSAQLQQLLTVTEDALTAESGTLASLRTATRNLAQAARLNPQLQPLATRLESAQAELEDAAYELARNSLEDSGPQSLEEIDDRLHALRAAARKHQVEVAQLPEVLSNLTQQTSNLVQLEEQLATLAQAEQTARSTFAAACQTLTQARSQMAQQKGPQLNAALKDLHLPHAELSITLTPLPEENWNAAGAENVELLLAANPGSPAQPIGKVASGGELSRLMLAVKRVVYQGLAPQVVVFDEIDAGLSGRAATSVGVAMAGLGTRHQVLTITHHAQVAAQAGQHGQIAKQVEDGQTRTAVLLLNDEHRLEELARLLSGAHITPQARAAAQALREESLGKAA